MNEKQPGPSGSGASAAGPIDDAGLRGVRALLASLTTGTPDEIADTYSPQAKIRVQEGAGDDIKIVPIELSDYIGSVHAALPQLRATPGLNFRMWTEDDQFSRIPEGVRIRCRMCTTLDPNGVRAEYDAAPSPDGKWRIIAQRTYH